ncbi:MAG: LPS assembly lipoprotein LptE [Cyclobacteriaceae bacterium]
MKNNVRSALLFSLLVLVGFSCGVYSFTGASTAAETIQVGDFFNNTDLAPANIGQTFTNSLKDYYQRNSSLSVVQDGGQLRIEGTITEYAVRPMAPVTSGNNQQADAAALTRLTIGVKATYEDTLEPKNSFKDRTFSFYADFPNDQDLTSIQEQLERQIFDQILLDIFNATVANW